MEEEIAVYLGMEVTGRCCGGATGCGVGVGEAIIKPSARYYGPQLQLGFKMGLSIGHWAFRCLPRAGARSLSLCCSPPTRTNSSSPSSLPPPPTTQNPSPYLRSRAPNPKASPIPGPRRNGIAGLVPRRLLLRRFRRRPTELPPLSASTPPPEARASASSGPGSPRWIRRQRSISPTRRYLP
jgi:hypothetical protein